jgi:NAD(P)-dependent dehydrogenase (short-subunit alcohol dehydrogenase family)
MMLKDKVAVIYGAGGAIGGAVARAFAGEGAKLFLTGRRRAPVEAVARDIVSAGPLRRRRSTLSTNERWTSTYSR